MADLSLLAVYAFLKGGGGALKAMKRIGISLERNDITEGRILEAKNLVENRPEKASEIICEALEELGEQAMASVCALSMEIRRYCLNGQVHREELEPLLHPWSGLRLEPAFQSLAVLPLDPKWSFIYVPSYAGLISENLDAESLGLVPKDLRSLMLRELAGTKWLMSVVDLAAWGPGIWLEHPKSKERLLFESFFGKDLSKFLGKAHIEGVLSGLILNQEVEKEVREIISELKIRESFHIKEFVEHLAGEVSWSIVRGTLIGNSSGLEFVAVPWAGHVPPRDPMSNKIRAIVVGGLPKERKIRKLIPLIKKSEHSFEPWDPTKGDFMVFLGEKKVLFISMMSSRTLNDLMTLAKRGGLEVEYFILI